MKNLMKFTKGFWRWMAANYAPLSIIVSFVVGVATLIASIVSINVMKSQNETIREQTDIQKKQNQPLFSIVVRQQQDLDDGKYGTDILYVSNVGSKVLDFEIDADVFFSLSKCDGMDNDTVYFEVLDYFNTSSIDIAENNLIKSTWGVGNNRAYCKLYQQSIDASYGEVFYFLDKVILCKVKYEDILKEIHTLYFEGEREISEDQYKKYNTSARLTSTDGIALRKMDFAKMKMQVDECSMKHY